jgi:dihydrofolate reductase
MRLSLIAAVAENGVIGAKEDIPWRLPEDWKRFKATTMGHHLLMGRKTWESIGKPLPGRTTVVISRGHPELPEGVHLASSLDEAIEIGARAADDEVFVAGGAGIYRLALPRADRLYLTRVHASIEGDTLFPEWNQNDWRLAASDRHEADAKHPWAFTFQIFDRR